MQDNLLGHRQGRHDSPSLAIALMLFVAAGCSKPEPPPLAAPAANSPIQLVAGTYTDRESRGIYQLTYDPATRSFTPPTLLVELSNPSYGTASHDRESLYFVVEDSDGRVQALSRSPVGDDLTPRSSHSTQGAHPCYLALRPDQRQLAIANYTSGNVAVFELDAAGALQSGPRVLQHRGAGADPERQDGPHAHWVEWNPEATFLYVVDLGLDRVMAYPVDQETGELGDGFTALETAPGAGPRHMVFHPQRQLVYLLNELSNEVLVAARTATGRLERRQTISSLPEGSAGTSLAAHIAINTAGSRLYVSNRGHDSLAVFEIAADGTLRLLQHIGTGGHWPRFFLLLDEEDLLLVANQRSDNLVAFAIDAQGALSRVGEPAAISQPTYLQLFTSRP